MVLDGEIRMTTKRFTIPKGYRVIKDNVTNECATFYDNNDGEIFLKWLNKLVEENQELKRLVKVTVEDYNDLKQSFDLIDKENEQLQSLNKYLIALLEKSGATVEIEKVKKND